MNQRHVTLIILLKALLIGAFILLGPIGLGPDEAQYWTWSKQLDWGYFSKPPGIAWQIWFGTQLFGDTELGVRFGAIVLGLALPAAVFLLATACCAKKRTALLAALIMALTPLGILASFLAITDTGMTLFWILATWAFILSDYLLVGCFIALGALFKWPIYAFWLIVAGMWPFYKEIRSKTVILGILISLLGLIPSLYWNAGHDWASFKHVFSTILGYHVDHGAAQINRQSNFFEFLGAQILLLSPIIFGLLVAAFVSTWREKRPAAIQFLAINCFSILGLCLFLSLFKKIQGNWGSYCYPAGIVLVAWFCSEQWKRGMAWLQAGLILSVLLMCFAFSIPTLQMLGVPIPYKFNPFHHNVGWNLVDQALREKGYDPQKHFLFGDKYQTASIFSFYGPGQKRAYFLNVKGSRKNQFSYWPQMKEEQIGKTGYFVFYEKCAKEQECIDAYREILQEYFNQVEFLGATPLFQDNKILYIFRASEYNGKEPVKIELY